MDNTLLQAVSARRRIGWLPTDLAGLVFWLDASQGTLDEGEVPCDNGEGVKFWQDQSGNGYDVRQDTGAMRPVYIASGLNSQPVVRFDGVSHQLDSVYDDVYGGFHTTTIFIVYDSDITTTGTPFCVTVGSDDYSDANAYYFEISGGWAAFARYTGRGDEIILNDNSFSVDIPILFIVDFAATSARAWINGIMDTDDYINVDNINPNQSHVGTRALSSVDLFNGDVAEIIVYNSVLSGEDRGAAEAYLKDKYGFTY